ncbi:MAG: 30S ribosomal protein S16 [Treponema sp.]|nr:30S ribosomal protein S16 [Treponema sp.]
MPVSFPCHRGGGRALFSFILSLWGKKQVVKIRLKRFGTKARPDYRIVVLDARKPRDGATIEEIGQYHPIAPEGKQMSFNEERAKYWLSVGAQPTAIVKKIFNTNGLSVKGQKISK